MGRALFDNQDFLAAARALASERGPASVTVDFVVERLKAPKGSFYYRFPSRDALLGEVWLTTILAYQEGFVAAIDAGDGLAAALHTPRWARLHLEDACLLLLYSRHDFVEGDWPASLTEEFANKQTASRLVERFARQAFGSAGAAEMQSAAYVLAEAPVASIKGHLRRREPPPPLVDDLIAKTFRAIVEA